MTRRRLQLLAVMFVLLVALMIFQSWRHAHPPITVTTDRGPVRLSLHNKTYTINPDQHTIRLPRGAYNYQVSYRNGNDNIVLYGSVDTINNTAQDINLDYSLFTDTAVMQAICDNAHQTLQNCLYGAKPLSVQYFEDHSWAVARVAFTTEDVSHGFIALALNNGSWNVAAGPVSTPQGLAGLVPQDVWEGIR